MVYLYKGRCLLSHHDKEAVPQILIIPSLCRHIEHFWTITEEVNCSYCSQMLILFIIETMLDLDVGILRHS